MPELFDEMVRALRRDAGLPDRSPLPGHSEVAANLGRVHQRTHDGIGRVALSIGAISSSLGDVAGAVGRHFSAREYRVFNECLDTSTAAAIDEYAARERAQQHQESSKRLGSLVHEIRNALSSARMSYAALKEGAIGINSRTGAVLERSLDRMQDLVNEGIVATQIEAGVQPRSRRIRLAELCRDLEAAAIRERGVTLRVEAQEDLEVEADERLLISALSNLLQNGLKFTRDGGAVVLRATRDEKSGNEALLEVEDQCGGLPDGQVEELTEPFVQRGQDRTGMGLGLTIAREAVESQGGRLTVEDRPGEGCVFRLHLGNHTH
jgi:signal transduction histidine kinase